MPDKLLTWLKQPDDYESVTRAFESPDGSARALALFRLLVEGLVVSGDRVCLGPWRWHRSLGLDPGWTQSGPKLRDGGCKLLIGGGRCRIRTYDFHRVKVALYR